MNRSRTKGMRRVRDSRGEQPRREKRRLSPTCTQYAANILALTPESSPKPKRRRIQPSALYELHLPSVLKLTTLPPMLSPLPSTPLQTPSASPEHPSISLENSCPTPPVSSAFMDWSSFRAESENTCASPSGPSNLDAPMESPPSSASSVALEDWSDFREMLNSMRCSSPTSMSLVGGSISPRSLFTPSPRSSRCTQTISSHSSESLRSPSPARQFWSPGCPLPSHVKRPIAVFRVRPGTPRPYRGSARRLFSGASHSRLATRRE